MPKLIDGIWRPDEDIHGVNAALDQVNDLDEAIKHCFKRDIAIQAGGNCGIFPRYLSKKFKYVYTFEPEGENFFCLVNNAPQKNIIKLQAAIGNKNTSSMGLMYMPKNCGGFHLQDSGLIPVISLDSLNLPACDLLQLDIEGYELFALNGAEKTINKFSPVIMIEHKKHAARYGANPDDIINLLKEMGYKEAGRVRRDIIFTRGKHETYLHRV